MKYQKSMTRCKLAAPESTLIKAAGASKVPAIGLLASVRSGLWPKSPGFI